MNDITYMLHHYLLASSRRSVSLGVARKNGGAKNRDRGLVRLAFPHCASPTVVTRMDALKSGWTHYVYNTTRFA